MQHQIIRIRHEVKRRRLTVRETLPITTGMLRVVLEGDDLADFVSSAPDDHVKLFIPAGEGAAARRDFTPRRFDPEACTLAIDFALHDGGPATNWAMAAQPGDTIEVGGPRGSVVVPMTFAWWLLVADETGLPALGRRLEEMPGGVRVTSLVAVAGPGEEQAFRTEADHRALWVHRPLDRADDPGPLLAVLETLDLPSGDGFVWTAAEARVARAVRDHICGTRGHPSAWTRMSGYWVKGQADAQEKFE